MYNKIYRYADAQPPPRNWPELIDIPTRFSISTNTSLKSGVPSASARDEIIKSLSILILVYTDRPTPEECATICKRLVDKFSILKDHQGNGYVSITIILYHSSI